jgi:HTH-type transcriptional regulator/antitoxin HigA
LEEGDAVITNERQYRISKAQLKQLSDAVDGFDVDEAMLRIGSPVLAKAELDALRSEVEVLTDQIKEYEALKSGAVTLLEADSLEELPTLLIRARIANGLSQRQLAEALGLSEQQVQRYESDQYASASLTRISKVAAALNLDISEVGELRSQRSEERPQRVDINWELFPVGEMYRRRWFRGFKGSLTAAMAQRVELVSDFIQEAMPRRQQAFLRSRARLGAEMDPYALWAWQCRILILSKKVELPTSFSRSSITAEWLQELVRLSRYDDGPQRAKEALREIGIPLVVEPHLPRTYLDGAAFLLPNGTPVVGLTLRYDRLDNFWFVLIHELVHIRDHLRKGKLEDIFDDLEAQGDELERQTDSEAGQILIPEDQWETALPRYLRTEDSVSTFADEVGIHSAIVAGRIRKEADNYIIMSDLVGHGEVRRQFPDVQFVQ